MNNLFTAKLVRFWCRSAALALVLITALASVTLADDSNVDVPRPTFISIPSIDLNHIVKPVGLIPVVVNGKTYQSWDVLDNNVGWHNRSARLGRIGNTVLSGHSDAKARVFRNLEKVEIGAEILVYDNSRLYRYRVTRKFLVQEKGVSLETRIKNAQWIAPTDDERLTLVTCAKPGATHRLIVIARPAPRLT